MATKSTRSSGTQINQRGVTQGNTLVDPKTGLPIDVVVDSKGIRRLAVDSTITLSGVTLDVALTVPDDGVHIGNPSTGTVLLINPDGSINTNIKVDASDGDNIAISDGTGLITSTVSGSKRSLDVNVSNGAVKLEPTGITVTTYGTQTVNANQTLTVVQYTVPTGDPVYLQRLYVSGEVVGKFIIYKNSSIIMIVRLSQTNYYQAIDLATNTAFGVPTAPGDVIKIDVLNVSTNSAIFDATIQTMNT